jgi:hypothetical protein
MLNAIEKMPIKCRENRGVSRARSERTGAAGRSYDAFGFLPVPLQGTQTLRCPRALMAPTPRQ